MTVEDAIQEHTVGYMNTFIQPRKKLSTEDDDVVGDPPPFLTNPVPRNRNIHHPIVTQRISPHMLHAPLTSESEPSVASRSNTTSSKSSNYSSVRSRYTSEGSESYRGRVHMRKIHRDIDADSLLSTDQYESSAEGRTSGSYQEDENPLQGRESLSDTVGSDYQGKKKQNLHERAIRADDVVGSSAESEFSLSALNTAAAAAGAVGQVDPNIGKVPLRLWRPTQLAEWNYSQKLNMKVSIARKLQLARCFPSVLSTIINHL